MTHIDRIRMRLPAGFEHRAATIARRVCEVLAGQSVSKDVAMDNVSITLRQVRANTSDDEIAQMIVNRIVAGYGGGLR